MRFTPASCRAQRYGAAREAVSEGRVVLAEIDRQSRRGPGELLRIAVAEDELHLIRVHSGEFLATGFNEFKTVFRGQFVQFLLALGGDADAAGRESEGEFPSSGSAAKEAAGRAAASAMEERTMDGGSCPELGSRRTVRGLIAHAPETCQLERC